MSQTFKELNIGRNQKTFIIAEAGINHNGDLSLALKLVESAKQSGADAIKFQTYVTEKRVPNDSPIFSILKQCELSPEQQKEIKARADQLGIMFFSTPFDDSSVDFLQSIGVPLIKIASFDIVNKKLLTKAAATKIPIIVSRGMANQQEINQAVEIFKAHNCDFAILHCISAYPTPKEAVNLRVISSLLNKYDCPIGYSDHTLDLDASIYAVVAGASIIEKHFTLDRELPGPDQQMSVNPTGLKTLCQKIREVEVILGRPEIRLLPAEEGTVMYRRPS